MTTGIENPTFARLKDRIRGYLPSDKIAAVESAYLFAEKCHYGEKRLSGEPFIEHPLKVALILAELQLDGDSLVAALLHDVTENCGVPAKEIESKFSLEIARLVDGVTRLGKLSLQGDAPGPRATQAENLRKMLVAMAEDLRVVFIKLADRLHNMSTLDPMPPARQKEIAQETMEIYAPLAHRLGIWELKWQLEDLSFRYLEPEKYREIAALVATRRGEREKFIGRVIQILGHELDKSGIRAEVSGRPKHLYSIYQKIQKYNTMGKDFDDIHDLLALRVLVSSVPECYTALGLIHNLWHPLPEEFDDFIANPKPNGYKSLHTIVMAFGRTPLEVQIRTREMHHVNEYGVAAHWRYKEGEQKDIHFEERVGWLRQLIEWRRELSGAEEFLESVKTDIFIDQVFVFTPKGEIKDLPKGSTPIDFAYRVHTDLGHRCIGARVNGRLVPLTYQLNNGDVVEIIASKKEKGPTRDWLSPHLGYVKTSQARSKIRQWFTHQERTENAEKGREMLDKELARLGIKQSEREELAKHFKYASLEDFLVAIGVGAVSTQQIATQLAMRQEPVKPPETGPVTPRRGETGIQVQGTGNVETHLAQCCNPVPGDKIIGYVTRSRGVTIHCQDCYNVIHEDEKERLIPVEWGVTRELYPVKVQVEAWDRVGMMRDISALVADEKVNITAVDLVNHENHTVTMNFTLETGGLTQLSRLLVKMERVTGIISVARVGDDSSNKKTKEVNLASQ